MTFSPLTHKISFTLHEEKEDKLLQGLGHINVSIADIQATSKCEPLPLMHCSQTVYCSSFIRPTTNSL